MNSEELQFIFSLFSLVGVVGILFYLVVERTKREALESEILSLKSTFSQPAKSQEQNETPEESEDENPKEKIIALYEEGADIGLIEDALKVPRAKIEMVIKFHNLNKADNWRKSVNNTL